MYTILIATFFYVLLTVHLSTILVIDQLSAQILFYIEFIIFLCMFRALLCSSSVGQNCIIQHLVSSGAPDGHLLSVMIPDAV